MWPRRKKATLAAGPQKAALVRVEPAEPVIGPREAALNRLRDVDKWIWTCVGQLLDINRALCNDAGRVDYDSQIKREDGPCFNPCIDIAINESRVVRAHFTFTPDHADWFWLEEISLVLRGEQMARRPITINGIYSRRSAETLMKPEERQFRDLWTEWDSDIRAWIDENQKPAEMAVERAKQAADDQAEQERAKEAAALLAAAESTSAVILPEPESKAKKPAKLTSGESAGRQVLGAASEEPTERIADEVAAAKLTKQIADEATAAKLRELVFAFDRVNDNFTADADVIFGVEMALARAEAACRETRWDDVPKEALADARECFTALCKLIQIAEKHGVNPAVLSSAEMLDGIIATLDAIIKSLGYPSASKAL